MRIGSTPIHEVINRKPYADLVTYMSLALYIIVCFYVFLSSPENSNFNDGMKTIHEKISGQEL